MKLKDLKRILDNLTHEQLNSPIIYSSDEYSISGEVKSLKKAVSNLYYTGDDDPTPLYTKAQLKKHGYSNGEIEGFSLEIKKGEYFIEL